MGRQRQSAAVRIRRPQVLHPKRGLPLQPRHNPGDLHRLAPRHGRQHLERQNQTQSLLQQDRPQGQRPLLLAARRLLRDCRQPPRQILVPHTPDRAAQRWGIAI